jgi:Ca-activated chloride channel family protein
VKKTILVTALEHQLVSRYTSLVAVDKVVSKPRTTPSQESMVTTAAPRGLQLEAVFGGGSATATPSAMHILAGALLVVTGVIVQLLRRRGWRR